ncbi:MAG: SDR family oxidoreductase [Verrucomicrobiales bacterium]|nr:SDR family oxidoreductase [Verrucomicrobiales bacterium]
MSRNENPVGLVVGGSGGIGSALAARLVRSGWQVIIAARDEGRLQLAAADSGAITRTVDARNSAEVDSLVQSVTDEFGRLDGAVNCVGSILLKPAHLVSDQEFTDTITINLLTAFYLLRASARVMMKQSEGGSIVLCSSVAAQRGLINHEAIAAAKAGVEGLALASAASYARFGIRVNCVAPGLTRTNLTRTFTQHESVAKASAALHPLGRIGEGSEVASAIQWLLDREQSWVTGQVIGIDGGLGHLQARG